MPYSNKSDLLKVIDENTLAQLTDDDAGEAIDDAVIDDAIADADELIDVYLRTRYDVPLSDPPGILKQISRNLALYNLYARRPETEMPETIMARNENAGNLLASIRDGKVTLGTATATSEEPDKFRTNKTDDDTLFTGKEDL